MILQGHQHPYRNFKSATNGLTNAKGHPWGQETPKANRYHDKHTVGQGWKVIPDVTVDSQEKKKRCFLDDATWRSKVMRSSILVWAKLVNVKIGIITNILRSSKTE